MKTKFLKRVLWLMIPLLTIFSTNVWGTTVTYTVTSTSAVSTSGTAPGGASATYSQTYGSAKQMTSGNSETLTLSNFGYVRITNITLSMRSNNNSGAGRMKYSTDGGTNWTYIIGKDGGIDFNQPQWYGGWSTSYVNVSKDVTINGTAGNNIVINIEATANSIYCESYAITYTVMTPHNVDWYVGDTRTKQETSVVTGTPPDVADGALGGSCSSLKFVGWSESDLGSSGSSAPADLFKGPIDLTANKTYHAVFAEETTAATSYTAVYTISSKNTFSSSGTKPDGSSATIAETYSTSKQMTAGNSQTATFSNYGTHKITNITLHMRSNTSAGSGKLRYSTDGGTNYTYLVGSEGSSVGFSGDEWYGAWSTSYVNVSKDVDFYCQSGKTFIIIIEATTSSLYCDKYSITWGTDPIYASSSYKTSCVACTLNSITLNTSSATTTFCVGDAFSSAGLVTTATYTGGCSNKAVTPTSISSPSMATAGNKTITVSYTEGGVTKTATYDITVNAKYSVTWMVNGSSYTTGGPTTQVCPGTHVSTLPTAPDPEDYCGDKFVGWTDAAGGAYVHGTSNLYTTASGFPNATGNQIFYAVFADYDD